MVSGKRKRWLIFFLVVAQIIVVVGLLEVVVRSLAARNDTIKVLSYDAAFVSDYSKMESIAELLTSTSFGFQPYYPVAGFKLNSKGFRTPEYSRSKPQGAYRVCVIGDSFAFASGGTPFPRMWPTLLEKKLQRTMSPGAQVINLGFVAVGPLFEFRVWQLEGSKLEADLVVLAFFVGNDFVDGSQISAAGSSIVDKTADHSYLVRVFRNWMRVRAAEKEEGNIAQRIERLAGRELGEGGPVGKRGAEAERRAGIVPGYHFDPTEAKFPPQTYNKMVVERMSIVRRGNEDYFNRIFEGVARIILEFQSSVTASGAQFLLMIIPDEYQVDPQVFHDAVVSTRKYAKSDYDIELPQARLTQLCEENGIEYLDLLPAFREHAQSTKLYKLRDTHWSPEGNALAAEILAERIRKDRERDVGAGSGDTN